MYNTIFTVSLAVLFFLFVGIGLLGGLKKVWYYALSRVASAVISAVASFFLAGAVTDLIGDVGYDILIDKLPEKISGTVKDVASAPDIFAALVTMILSPLFFVILYIVLKAILNCIAKNICIAVAKKKALANASPEITEIPETVAEEKYASTGSVSEEAEAEDVVAPTVTAEVTEEEDGKKKKKAKKEKKAKTPKPKKIKRGNYIKTKKASPAGMICGVVCGFILFFVVMVPFVGTATIADKVMSLVSEFITDETIKTVTEITDAAANNYVSKAVGVIGGRAVFDGLTTSRIGEHSISLNKEVDLVTTTGTAVLSTINNNVPREEAAADIREVSVAFSDSALLPVIIPEFLTAANESWEKGEDFHGIKKITASGNAKAVVDPLVDILVHSDYDTIKTDADTLVEIVAILIEQDAINTLLKDPKSLPENEEMTAPVLYELLENEHLSPMVGTLAEFGVQYIGGQLHLHAHRDALYDEFTATATANVSAILSAGFTNSSEQLTSVYGDLFDDYGLTVSAESISQIAELTVTAFPEGTVDAQAMKSFLATVELTLTDGKVIKLDSADALADNSMLICVDEIHFDVSNISDKNAESRALARAVHEVFSLTTLIKTGAFADAKSIQKLGPMLDALAHTEAIGEDDTGRLLTGILQSDMIHDQIGFSLVGATDVANTINGKSHTQGYSPLMKSLSDTVEIVKLTTNDSATKEEVNAKVEVLLEELTPESAEVLQKITTTEVMVSQGVPEQSAEPVSNLVSNMFGNLASAKDNGMSDEEFKKEAEATSNLLNMALAATSSGKNIFAEAPAKPNPPVAPDEGTDGEGSGSGDNEGGSDNEGEGEGDNSDGEVTEPAPTVGNSMTASDYIDSVMNSTVISQTIVEATFTEENAEDPVLDPLNMGKTLSENEQAQVLDSLNEHWANATEEEKANADYFKTYAAIGAMVNFPITIGEDGTIIPVTAVEEEQ